MGERPEQHGSHGVPAEGDSPTEGPPASPQPWPSPPAAPGGGLPPAPPPPEGYVRRSTNGFAIASLVLGVLGGIFLSIIFGIIALRQIKQRGQDGRGMAIAGLVCSGVWVVLFVVGGILFITTSAQRDESGEIVESGDVNVREVGIGDCLDGLGEGAAVLSVTAVPCEQPHQGEAYAVFDMTDGEWPGDEAVQKAASEGCDARLRNYTEVYEDDAVGIFFFHPTSGSWSEGDREVVCIAEFTSDPRTGSLFD